MGMGFVSTWIRQVSPPPLLHMTTLTTAENPGAGIGTPKSRDFGIDKRAGMDYSLGHVSLRT